MGAGQVKLRSCAGHGIGRPTGEEDRLEAKRSTNRELGIEVFFFCCIGGLKTWPNNYGRWRSPNSGKVRLHRCLSRTGHPRLRRYRIACAVKRR